MGEKHLPHQFFKRTVEHEAFFPIKYSKFSRLKNNINSFNQQHPGTGIAYSSYLVLVSSIPGVAVTNNINVVIIH